MPELYPEDQKKVDEFISSNVNSIERTPFKPFKLLSLIVVILSLLTAVSYWVATTHGII